MNEAYLNAIKQYIEKNAPRVFKKAGGVFSYPFIDPGSVYDANLWDWDSFWTVCALMACRESDETLAEHARGGVLNFLSFQMEDGYIPMMVNRQPMYGTYLLDKHREGKILNMHKPFLCQQALVICGYTGDFGWIASYIGQLERYFECYDRYYLHKNTGLYVWADDVMIGMDNDPATFGRPRFSTANVFLNGFMTGEMKAMAKLLRAFGREDRAIYYLDKAKTLALAIQAECYDPRDRFFYSVDVDIKTRSYDWFHQGLGVFWKTLPIKIRTWTGFIPLFTGIATPEQARDITRLHIEDPSTFACGYGIRTLARDEKMYNLEATNNPSNWLGPVWTVANYVAFRGLLNYGYRNEARQLCEQTIELLGRDLVETGELHEYYNPETGHQVMNPGFLNWNMLVVNMANELESGKSVLDVLGFMEDIK